MVSVSVEVVRARTVILYSCVYPTQTNAVMDKPKNTVKAFLHAETGESAAAACNHTRHRCLPGMITTMSYPGNSNKRIT